MARTTDDGVETLYGAGQQYVASAAPYQPAPFPETDYSLGGGGFDSFNVSNAAPALDRISDGLGHWWDSATQSWQNDSGGAYQEFTQPQDDYFGNFDSYAPENTGTALYEPPVDIPFAPDSWSQPAPQSYYPSPNAVDPWSANFEETSNYGLNDSRIGMTATSPEFDPKDAGFFSDLRVTDPQQNGYEEDVRFPTGGGMLGSPTDYILPALNAPYDYVGKPAFGVLSGLTEADRQPIYDEYGNITGYTRDPGLGGILDIPKAVGKFIADPVGQYGEARKAADEYFANPENSPYWNATGRVALDPLSYAGPAAAAKVIPEGIPLGGLTRGLIDQGGGASVIGGALGGTFGASDTAENIPLFGDQPAWLRGLEGGLIGGVAGLGAPKLASGALENAGGVRGLLAGEGGETPPLFGKGQGNIPPVDAETERRAIQDFLDNAPTGKGTVPAREPYLPTRDESFAADFNQPGQGAKTQSALRPGIESAQEAIANGRALGYRDEDIAAYLRRNYPDFADASTPARTTPIPPSAPDTAKPLKSAADIVNPETGTPDVAQYVNADAVSRRRILDSFQDVATREGRPTGGIYDDILPTEQVKTGLMRGYEGKTGTAGLALQRDLDNGNRALRQADIGRMNGRSLQVFPKRINGKVDPNDDVVQLFKALHGEGEPPPKLKPVFDDLKRMVAEEADDTLRQNKDFVLKDDYFYRGWKAPKETASGVGKGQVGAKPGYQKPRVDATFSELIDQGWEPLSWNPYEMASLRRYAGVQFREQKALVDALKKTGLAVTIDGGTPVGWRVPRVGPAFEGKPFAFTPDAAPLADAVGAKVGYTQQFAVPEKLANEIENIFGKTPDMGAILNTIAGAGQKAKQLKLVASLFQQVDFATRQGAAGFASAIDSLVAGQPLSAVKKLITVPSDMAKLPISNLSGARQRQLRDMILDGKPLLKERPGVSLKSISDAGWSTSDITVVNRTIKQSLDDMLSDPKGLRKLASDVGGDATITGAPLRTLKKLNEASQRGLFEGVYPQAQATTLKKFVVPKLVRQHPEWTDAQISAAAATEINKMFSTLGNFQQVVKNPVSKKFLGSLIFSTNETESLLRQAASTVVGPNKAMWTEYYAGAFVFLAATANLVNYAATGKPLDFGDPLKGDFGDYSPVKKDPYSPLGYGYNNRFMAPQVPFLKGRNGTPVRLDLMGQLDTVFRMLDPHGFIESRENVIPRAAMSQMQGEDFFGRPLKGPKERIGQLAADLFEPIGAQQVRGALDIGPDSEGRLGNIGQAIQGSGVNLRAEPTRDMKDRLAQDTYGKKWDELSPTQQENIKRENPNFQSELDTRRDESAAQNNEYAIRQKAAADATALLTTQQTASDEKRATGELTPEQWRKDYTERKNDLYVRNDQIYADAGDFQTKDPIRAPFYKAIDDATGKDGKVDWDKVDAYRATLSAEDNAYLDRETGLTRIVTPKTQEFKEDYDAIKATGYFARSDTAWKDVAGLVPTWNALGTPVNPSDYDDYYDWRQAALKAGLDLAGKTFEDIATVTQIESWLDKQEPAKGMDYYGSKWKDEWVASNPREAYDAWKYGYYTPKKEIKAWLAGQFE